MIATWQEENVYVFKYNGVKRVVFCTEVKDSFIRGWDFSREGYRTFTLDRIADVSDITESRYVSFTPDYGDVPIDCQSFYHNNEYCVVRIKRQ